MVDFYFFHTKSKVLLNRIIDAQVDEAGVYCMASYPPGYVGLITPRTRRHVDWKRFEGEYTLRPIYLKKQGGTKNAKSD